MPQPDHGFEIHLYNHRPPCSHCGAPTALKRIEPAADPDHDLRTFECKACGRSEDMLVKFK